MAVLTLGTDTTGMIGQTRLLMQDVSSAGYALTTAQVTSLLNDKYLWYKDQQQDRTQVVPLNLFVGASGLYAGRNLTIDTNIKKIYAIIKSQGVAVLLCSTNGNTTLNTSTSFSTVKAGWSVTGTDIPAGTTVASIQSTTALTLSQAATGSHTPLTMSFYPNEIYQNAPIERVEMNEFYDDYAGGINAYALEREPGQGGKWTIHYSPATGESAPTPCLAVVTYEVTALAASGDTPELTDHESYMVCRMAAVEGARLIGRDDATISKIALTLPQEIQDALKVSAYMREPRTRQAEEAF